MASTVATPMDLWRLAEEAERRGIQILVEPISGEHFATSGSKANILYRLTGFSCTCKGFQHWQRCTHHSLLLAQLGWLPDPEPDPPSPVARAFNVQRLGTPLSKRTRSTAAVPDPARGSQEPTPDRRETPAQPGPVRALDPAPGPRLG